MLLTTCYGYYQPAGPLISTHHHHHSSSSSSSVINTGKAPVVLSTLESSPTPTPPLPPSSVTSHGVAPPPQIISTTSTSSGNTRGGDESSDNDVIITAATSCGEVAPVAPPAPQPLTLQQQPPPVPTSHHATYRYPQAYPPPPTPSTPQHIHHQSYAYNYPHTQYYPSPPSSASIQYSAVASNPQHHHYHNQDLCYSGATSNYPPASYFHHKSYTTPPPPPPPPSYHRRYIAPPPHHSQYYPPELYSSSAVANAAGQQNTQQNSQQSQQMVVTASSGSVSSYQPPPVGVGNTGNHPPPTLVETYPPPPPIVDPYPPPPAAYYTSYSAGPGAPGCYSHSPPTRGLAFIDATYQSCPCPMQSCPKNVHTGPLTGDGKGPHLPSSKQQDSFHHVPPLPPVALALPLEPTGAMGPPSPARGSAGMPPPPSPTTASAAASSDLDAKQLYIGETATEDSGAQILPAKSEITVLPTIVGTVTNGDSLQHGLLTISKVNNNTVSSHLMCDKKSKKKNRPTVAPPMKVDNGISMTLSDRDIHHLKRHSLEVLQPTEFSLLDAKREKDVKLEATNPEEEEVVFSGHKSVQHQLNNGGVIPNIQVQKRRLSSAMEGTPKSEIVPTLKRRKSFSSAIALSHGQDSPKTQQEMCETQNLLQEMVISTAVTNNCKTGPKCQPLSANSCSVHNAKQNTKKRKLDDTKDLMENKEPKLSVPSVKRVATAKVVRVQNKEAKIYPSRAKQAKNMAKVNRKLTASEALDSIIFENRTICDSLNAIKNNGLNLSQSKKLPSGRFVGKKMEEKVNGSLFHEQKKMLRQHSRQSNSSVCTNGHVLRVGQLNVSKVCAEAGKAHRRKQQTGLQTGGRKTIKSNHMLRRHGLREPSPDQMLEEDTESSPCGVKVSSRSLPSTHSPAPLSTRRSSNCTKKEQSKKLCTAKAGVNPTCNDISSFPHQANKRQLQMMTIPIAQDAALLPGVLRKVSLKKSLPLPKWSNGWSFEGEPFQAKVFLTSDDPPVARKCYPAMRHTEGDVIHPRDCVLLKSGPRKVDLPFVAKVAALWENPDDGEMMVSLLWYYRPEHTEQGRRSEDVEDEIFASKHKDINSVACIEDKCYVLTFNEYCRYRKCVRRLEDGVREPGLVVPQHDGYPRHVRQPPGCVAADMVFFCRRVYDFRQRRILKNPG